MSSAVVLVLTCRNTDNVEHGAWVDYKRDSGHAGSQQTAGVWRMQSTLAGADRFFSPILAAACSRQQVSWRAGISRSSTYNDANHVSHPQVVSLPFADMLCRHRQHTSRRPRQPPTSSCRQDT